MRKNIVIAKKKALALLTAFLFSAGIFLATVVNVQGNSNAQNFGISSDLASSAVVKDMAVFGKQINTVNSLISMDVSHNHQLKNSGNIQTSLLRSARDQLTKIDAYAINHNVNPNTLSVNTVVNTTSSTIHVYLVRSYNSVQNTYYQSFSVSGLTSSQSVHVKLTRLKAVQASTTYGSGNWDGYSFYNPHPWYYFGGNYPIDWVSEGITVPSMENPPASQIVGGGVPIAMVGWDSLSANWQGNTMVQAGWYWESGMSNPLVWWEFVYPGQSSSTNHIMPISGQTSHPVHFGDYMYVYINENSTSQYYVLISDITNGIDYSAQVTTSAYTFTPYYFGSIIEAPEYGSTYAQIPEFSNFQVNSLSFYSNGNTLLYGSTEYSASNYYYFYLQQSSNGQNINNQFSTSGDGYYNVGWANSYYSASYISSH